MPGIDNHTLLMLHMDGDKFTDEMGHTINNSGVTIDSNIKKVGDGSAHFDSASDLLVIPYTNDLNLAIDEFTIDFWFYFHAFLAKGANAATFFTNRNIVYPSESFSVYMTSSTFFINYFDNQGHNYTFTANITIVKDQWNHFAITRKNGVLFIFLNGRIIATGSVPNLLKSSNLRYVIGSWNTYGDGGFSGYIDEFRISNVARWTTDFTPSSQPYGRAKYLFKDGDNIKTLVGEIANQIPIMTSNTTPSGEAKASSVYIGGSYQPWRAFTRSVNGGVYDCWVTVIGETSGWISYDFTTEKLIQCYVISARDSVNRGDPKSWTFEGSNDETEWVILDQKSNQPAWNRAEKRSFTINNQQSFRFYRLNVTEAYLVGDANYLSIGELEMWFFGEWETIGTDVTEELFITQGMDGLDNVNNVMIQALESDKPQVLMYMPTSTTTTTTIPVTSTTTTG